MKNFRFRTNWFGKLILQIKITETYTTDPDAPWYGKQYHFWRDATSADLGEFYLEFLNVAPHSSQPIPPPIKL